MFALCTSLWLVVLKILFYWVICFQFLILRTRTERKEEWFSLPKNNFVLLPSNIYYFQEKNLLSLQVNYAKSKIYSNMRVPYTSNDRTLHYWKSIIYSWNKLRTSTPIWCTPKRVKITLETEDTYLTYSKKSKNYFENRGNIRSF